MAEHLTRTNPPITISANAIFNRLQMPYATVWKVLQKTNGWNSSSYRVFWPQVTHLYERSFWRNAEWRSNICNYQWWTWRSQDQKNWSLEYDQDYKNEKMAAKAIETRLAKVCGPFDFCIDHNPFVNIWTNKTTCIVSLNYKIKNHTKYLKLTLKTNNVWYLHLLYIYLVYQIVPIKIIVAYKND